MEAIISFFQSNFFTFEIIFCFIPYILLLKKKEYFWIRLLISLAFCIPLSIYLPRLLNLLLSSCSIVEQLISFPLIVALFVVAIKISFKDDIWTAILCGVSAYTTQHIFFRLRMFTMMILWRYDIHFEWLNYLYYWTELIALLLFCYFFFVRKLINQAEFKINNRKTILIMFVMLIVVLILNTVSMFQSFSVAIEVIIALYAYALITCVFILRFLFDNVYNKALLEEIEIIQLCWKQDRRQYQLSKQNIDLINMKFHDLKYYVNKNLKDEKSIEEINRCLNIYDSVYHTDNETLDVVLTEKKMLCDNKKIQFSCIADGKLLNQLNASDIYSLFSNAIDNAIEYLDSIRNEDKKFIDVSIRRIHNMIKIQVENLVMETPEIVDGFPKTTKQDKENHGYGTRSMYYIVKKYGGTIYFDANEGVFCVDILIPLKQ